MAALRSPAKAVEHVVTEATLRASGIPHVLLRNGWYTENHTGSIGAALHYGPAQVGLGLPAGFAALLTVPISVPV